jgi:hypothetical protein
MPRISETPGFYSGYDRLNDEDKKNIVFLEQDKKISDIEDKNKVYAIQAQQIRDFIINYDSCIIYIWSFHCSSNKCISPAACQKFCDDNNYQLIVISNYYTFPEMYNIMPLISNPLFTVNAAYYKTDYCHRYMRRFEKELLNGEHREHGYRYWVFIKGKFNRAIEQIVI